MPRIRPILNWLPVMQELLDQNQRAAAIIMGAFIDNNLAVAILSRLRQMGATKEDEMFGNENAPFNTFNQKIHMAWALNLYDNGVHHDLMIIKSIRNEFAHRLDIREFKHTRIADKCAALKFPAIQAASIHRPEVQEPKDRFLDTAHHMIDGLAHVARAIARPQPGGIFYY